MTNSAPATAVHADHSVVRFPRDAHFGAATPGKLGMWVFLISDALTFGGLLISYAVLRGGATVWRHPGEPELGINFTAGLTFLLICSSVTMVLAYAAASQGRRERASLWLALTALGGALFLVGQYHEYFGIWHPGLTKQGLVFGASAYASTFYVITSFHGAHVLSGVIYILVTRRLWQQGRAQAGHVELLGLFWHFVDLVWILVFTFVYLIP